MCCAMQFYTLLKSLRLWSLESLKWTLILVFVYLNHKVELIFMLVDKAAECL
jgi:hypothetical protein